MTKRVRYTYVLSGNFGHKSEQVYKKPFHFNLVVQNTRSPRHCLQYLEAISVPLQRQFIRHGKQVCKMKVLKTCHVMMEKIYCAPSKTSQ
jgi:hypothetical protein